jgi:hypothetical protein
MIFRRGISRMDDEHADHAHAHLGHFVMMRVEHLRAVLAQGEFVFHRLAGFYVWLGEPADAVHAVGKIEAMPMDRRCDR